MKERTGPILIVLALFLVFILLAWLGLRTTQPPSVEVKDYNLWKFKKIDGLWHTEWQRGEKLFDIALRYHPKDVKNIPVVGENLSDAFSIRPTIVLTFDFDTPEDNYKHLAVASADLNFNLIQVMEKNVVNACLQKVHGCENRPIVDCTENVSVIKVRLQQPTLLNISTPDCLTLQGEGENINKAVAKMLYTWYGIIR